MSDPWEKRVNVFLDSVGPPTRYRIEPAGVNPLPTGPNGLIFDNAGHDGFNIQFVFTDCTHSGYLWPPHSKKDEAVWSKVGSFVECPQDPDQEVFTVIDVDQLRTTLTVNNANRKPAQGPFRYTLCVTNNDGHDYLQLDPGGVNNNGPTSLFLLESALPRSSTYTAAAVVVVVVAVIVAYSFGLFG
jgi:hypothetical protein